MFIKKPFVAITSFVGAGLLVFFSGYFTDPYVDDSLISAIAEALLVIVCIMLVFFGIIYMVMNHQKPVEKQLGSVTKLPLKENKQDVSSMPMTG